MGLLLSILVVCVGVVELLNVYSNFRSNSQNTHCNNDLSSLIRYYDFLYEISLFNERNRILKIIEDNSKEDDLPKNIFKSDVIINTSHEISSSSSIAQNLEKDSTSSFYYDNGVYINPSFVDDSESEESSDEDFNAEKLFTKPKRPRIRLGIRNQSKFKRSRSKSPARRCSPSPIRELVELKFDLLDQNLIPLVKPEELQIFSSPSNSNLISSETPALGKREECKLDLSDVDSDLEELSRDESENYAFNILDDNTEILQNYDQTSDSSSLQLNVTRSAEHSDSGISENVTESFCTPSLRHDDSLHDSLPDQADDFLYSTECENIPNFLEDQEKTFQSKEAEICEQLETNYYLNKRFADQQNNASKTSVQEGNVSHDNAGLKQEITNEQQEQCFSLYSSNSFYPDKTNQTCHVDEKISTPEVQTLTNILENATTSERVELKIEILFEEDKSTPTATHEVSKLSTLSKKILDDAEESGITGKKIMVVNEISSKENFENPQADQILHKTDRKVEVSINQNDKPSGATNDKKKPINPEDPEIIELIRINELINGAKSENRYAVSQLNESCDKTDGLIDENEETPNEDRKDTIDDVTEINEKKIFSQTVQDKIRGQSNNKLKDEEISQDLKQIDIETGENVVGNSINKLNKVTKVETLVSKSEENGKPNENTFQNLKLDEDVSVTSIASDQLTNKTNELLGEKSSIAHEYSTRENELKKHDLLHGIDSEITEIVTDHSINETIELLSEEILVTTVKPEKCIEENKNSTELQENLDRIKSHETNEVISDKLDNKTNEERCFSPDKQLIDNRDKNVEESQNQLQGHEQLVTANKPGNETKEVFSEMLSDEIVVREEIIGQNQNQLQAQEIEQIVHRVKNIKSSENVCQNLDSGTNEVQPSSTVKCEDNLEGNENLPKRQDELQNIKQINEFEIDLVKVTNEPLNSEHVTEVFKYEEGNLEKNDSRTTCQDQDESKNVNQTNVCQIDEMSPVGLVNKTNELVNNALFTEDVKYEEIIEKSSSQSKVQEVPQIENSKTREIVCDQVVETNESVSEDNLNKQNVETEAQKFQEIQSKFETNADIQISESILYQHVNKTNELREKPTTDVPPNREISVKEAVNKTSELLKEEIKPTTNSEEEKSEITKIRDIGEIQVNTENILEESIIKTSEANEETLSTIKSKENFEPDQNSNITISEETGSVIKLQDKSQGDENISTSDMQVKKEDTVEELNSKTGELVTEETKLDVKSEENSEPAKKSVSITSEYAMSSNGKNVETFESDKLSFITEIELKNEEGVEDSLVNKTNEETKPTSKVEEKSEEDAIATTDIQIKKQIDVEESSKTNEEMQSNVKTVDESEGDKLRNISDLVVNKEENAEGISQTNTLLKEDSTPTSKLEENEINITTDIQIEKQIEVEEWKTKEETLEKSEDDKFSATGDIKAKKEEGFEGSLTNETNELRNEERGPTIKLEDKSKEDKISATADVDIEIKKQNDVEESSKTNEETKSNVETVEKSEGDKLSNIIDLGLNKEESMEESLIIQTNTLLREESKPTSKLEEKSEEGNISATTDMQIEKHIDVETSSKTSEETKLNVETVEKSEGDKLCNLTDLWVNKKENVEESLIGQTNELIREETNPTSKMEEKSEDDAIATTDIQIKKQIDVQESSKTNETLEKSEDDKFSATADIKVKKEEGFEGSVTNELINKETRPTIKLEEKSEEDQISFSADVDIVIKKRNDVEESSKTSEETKLSVVTAEKSTADKFSAITDTKVGKEECVEESLSNKTNELINKETRPTIKSQTDKISVIADLEVVHTNDSVKETINKTNEVLFNESISADDTKCDDKTLCTEDLSRSHDIQISSSSEEVVLIENEPHVPERKQSVCVEHNAMNFEEVSAIDQDGNSTSNGVWLIFSGEYTKAMNKDWHGQHFCCWQCDESLTGQRYVLRDDHPYCVTCYESVFANNCEKCSKTIGIDSKDLSYKDKHWHEACFLCATCGDSLVDKQFGSKGDRIYCGRCYDEQFASRCDGCGQIFRAGTKKMEYKTRQWHEKCFCCCVCKTPIGTQSFIPREQEIYCAKCYEEKYATRCIKCNKVITSGGVTYKNEPWHRECFTCTNCNTSLAGARFTSRDDKPYCAECFGELFAKRCTACVKPITGIGGTKFISFEDRHWHNDCFFCASCRTSLVGRGFITDADDIICPECAKQKLM